MNGCLLSCKDTNLKAIHNTMFKWLFKREVVFYLAKILRNEQYITSLLDYFHRECKYLRGLP